MPGSPELHEPHDLHGLASLQQQDGTAAELGQLGHRAAPQLRQPGGRGRLPEDEIRATAHRAAQQLRPVPAAALWLHEGQTPAEQDQREQQPGSPRRPVSLDSEPLGEEGRDWTFRAKEKEIQRSA